MLYVVNRFRNMTSTPEEAYEVLKEIEAVSGLKATSIINNSHMMKDTDEGILRDGLSFAEGVSKLTGLPMLGSTLKRDLFEDDAMKKALASDNSDNEIYPIDIFVKTVW